MAWSEEDKEKLIEQVEEVLDEVRPYIHSHGGDVQVIDVDKDGVVQVRLVGTCTGCKMSMITLKMGIQELLRDRIEGIKEVVAV